MHIELTTGQDSFRATDTASRRNLSVRIFTYNKDEGVIPLFLAFKKKLKGFKESRIIQNIPATEKFAMNDAGRWFRNRYEVAQGTELLVEYRHRNPSGGFGEDIEYMMLRTSPTAALSYVTLELQPHPISAVPFVFFEGRFDFVADDEELTNARAWAKHIGINDADIQSADVFDVNMEEGDRFYSIKQLEAAVKANVEAKLITDDTGKRVLKRIKRGRRIKTRG